MKVEDYIYQIYRDESFSVAAKKLFVSQPALSASVIKQEKALGFKIFDRSSSRIRLTEEGKIYIESLEKIRLAEEEMREKVYDVSHRRTGHITVSGDNFVSSFIMPRILTKFAHEYPGIKVDLLESNSFDLRQLLISEEIDLLIAHFFDMADFSAHELLDEEILLAVPESFEINNRLSSFSLSLEDVKNISVCGKGKEVPLSEFRNEKFLMLKKGNDMNMRAVSLSGEAGFTPKVRIYLDQMITSYNLACAGMGIAFVPDILVCSADERGCVYYRIKSGNSYRKMYIGRKKNKYYSNACAAFSETAMNVYKS